MSLGEILQSRRIVVCAGAGGVGKTTLATALALVAARRGRRVLALTIDPAKRLTEMLGALGDDRLAVRALDPGQVVEDALARLPEGPAALAAMRENRIFREVRRMVVGMQEYTAMEALHHVVAEERYDLVVVDTPPSRHALDFLEGPARLGRFLDGRAAQLFLPDASRGRLLARALGRVFGAALGEGTYRELQSMLVSFGGLFATVNAHAKAMAALLARRDVTAFVVVTSPAGDALAEALHVHARAAALGLPFEAFVLNRSLATEAHGAPPPPDAFGSAPTAEQAAALAKLSHFATLEAAERERDAAVLSRLRQVASDGEVVVAPFLPEGATDLEALAALGESLAPSVLPRRP